MVWVVLAHLFRINQPQSDDPLDPPDDVHLQQSLFRDGMTRPQDRNRPDPPPYRWL